MKKYRWRKLSCGHRLIYNGDIKKYMDKLINHVKKCSKAQKILIKNRKIKENE